MAMNDISTVNVLNNFTDSDANAESVKQKPKPNEDFMTEIKTLNEKALEEFIEIVQNTENACVLKQRSNLIELLKYCSQPYEQNIKLIKKSIQQLIKDSVLVKHILNENDIELIVDPKSIDDNIKILESIERNTELTNDDIVETESDEMDCDLGAVSTDGEDISYVSANSSTPQTSTHRSSIHTMKRKTDSVSIGTMTDMSYQTVGSIRRKRFIPQHMKRTILQSSPCSSPLTLKKKMKNKRQRNKTFNNKNTTEFEDNHTFRQSLESTHDLFDYNKDFGGSDSTAESVKETPKPDKDIQTVIETEEQSLEKEEQERSVFKSENEEYDDVIKNSNSITSETVINLPTNRSPIPRDFVTIMDYKSPQSFYVRKVKDKERLEYLSTELKTFVSSKLPSKVDLSEKGTKRIGYSSEMQCWCRVILIQYLKVDAFKCEATIFLIDYGITETVPWFHIREEKKELFDEKVWPRFAIKCSLFNIKPNSMSNTTDWSERALDLFKHYIKNNELVLFWLDFKDDINFVDLVHEIPHDFHYQIPSIIEVLLHYEYALLEDNIDFNSYLKSNKKPNYYPNRCETSKHSIFSVLVSHVESLDLFFVNHKKEYQTMQEMNNRLNNEYNDENSGLYTYYRPRINTPCAALFTDNKFYRALVKEEGKSINETVVDFVDLGNTASEENKNLRIIKNSFIKELRIQAIPCSLTDIVPNHGFKWSTDAIQAFKVAIFNDNEPKLLTICAEVVTPQKLEVVLRSYDINGKEEVVNQVLVRQGFALSNGPQSESYKVRDVSGLIALKEMCERNIRANADISSSLIKVNVCHVINPSKFYVHFEQTQLKQYFREMIENMTVEYNSPEYEYLLNNFIAGDMCAFKLDNEWRRGRVIEQLNNLRPTEVPEEPEFKVFDIDFGIEYYLLVSKMRPLVDNYAKVGSFAVECKMHSLIGMTANEWSLSAIDEFKDSVQTFSTDLYILVKNDIFVQPVSVELYAKEIVEIIPFVDYNPNPEKLTLMTSNSSQNNENLSFFESFYRKQMASNPVLQSFIDNTSDLSTESDFDSNDKNFDENSIHSANSSIIRYDSNKFTLKHAYYLGIRAHKEHQEAHCSLNPCICLSHAMKQLRVNSTQDKDLEIKKMRKQCENSQ